MTYRNETHYGEETDQAFVVPGVFNDSYGIPPFNILIDNGFMVPD